MPKVYPKTVYKLTPDLSEKDYQILDEILTDMLNNKGSIGEAELKDVYNRLRELLETENLVSLAKDLEKDCIYIFEYDWHKDMPFLSEVDDEGIVYLLPIESTSLQN